MLIFKLDRMEPLSTPTYLMHRLAYRANFKCSPSKFSIIVPNDSPRCVMALQIMPQFFTQYVCDQIHNCNFSIHNFYRIFSNMEQNGFTSLTFSLTRHLNQVALEFRDPEQTLSLIVVPTIPSKEDNVGKIDYSSFVSFDLEEFRHVILGLNGACAHVTLTDSQLKFSIENKDIILTKEGTQCIIGGVVAGDEIQFVIAIKPMEFFYNFTSERLWLFKSIESNGIILTAPFGLHAEISSFFYESF